MIYQRLCETVMFWQTPQSYSQISVLGCLSFPTKPSEFAGPHADLWKQAVVNTWIELGPSHSLPTLPLLLLGSSHTPFSELLGGPHSWVSWSQCTAANPHLGHSCLQSFPASGSFPMNQFFPSGGQSIGVSASASILPMNIKDWFPLGLTGLISLQSNGLSRVFSTTTVQKHQFFSAQLSSQYNSHIHT